MYGVCFRNFLKPLDFEDDSANDIFKILFLRSADAWVIDMGKHPVIRRNVAVYWILEDFCNKILFLLLSRCRRRKHIGELEKHTVMGRYQAASSWNSIRMYEIAIDDI